MINRLIISFILVFRSLGFSEDLQVKMLTKSFADVPVVGRVHHLQTTYLAKNQRNIIQTTSIESVSSVLLQAFFLMLKTQQVHSLMQKARLGIII